MLNDRQSPLIALKLTNIRPAQGWHYCIRPLATGEPAPESILQSVGSIELGSQTREDRQGEKRSGEQMIQSDCEQGIDIRKKKVSAEISIMWCREE